MASDSRSKRTKDGGREKMKEGAADINSAYVTKSGNWCYATKMEVDLLQLSSTVYHYKVPS